MSFLSLTFGKNYWSRMLSEANYQVMTQNMYLNNISLKLSDREVTLENLMTQITQDVTSQYNKNINDLQLQYNSGGITAEQLQEQTYVYQKARDEAISQAQEIIQTDDVLQQIQEQSKKTQAIIQQNETAAAFAKVQYDSAQEAEKQKISDYKPNL